MKMLAEILRSNSGYENILIDGILIADCDIKYCDFKDKLGEIISLAQEYDLSFRIYKTFGGLRPICISDFFRAAAPITHKILYNLESDFRYQNSIRKHKIFTCRTTPKPNRIGMEEKVNFYSMLPKEQKAWVEKYNELIKGFKTCEFVLQTSECEIPNQIQNFIKLHDERTGCSADLPLA